MSDTRPLADRLRPRSFDEVLGQAHLLGPEGPLRAMIDRADLKSVVFWGPPGTGKTTLARLMAGIGQLHYEAMSAIFSGVADLRKAFEQARQRRESGRGTLLFVDEIHRFNRAQQDGFLPYVEDGTIVLVGATTENPSFELNAALLSRLQVLVLKRLDDNALGSLLQRAETALDRRLPLSAAARDLLFALADGDGRYLCNMIEQLATIDGAKGQIDADSLLRRVQRRAPAHDKDRDGHYNLISALHKALRGSDADAALYWLARMVAGGDDPLYIARRLIRFAGEDIGLADPQALQQALAARATYHLLGSPEGELALAQAVIYLATAPKSNAAYRAWKKAQGSARKYGSLMPPAHILNAPTRLMKELGYGQGYAYDHDTPDGFSGQNYFPEGMQRARYYHPVQRGFEREIRKRLAYWDRLRARTSSDQTDPTE